MIGLTMMMMMMMSDNSTISFLLVELVPHRFGPGPDLATHTCRVAAAEAAGDFWDRLSVRGAHC